MTSYTKRILTLFALVALLFGGWFFFTSTQSLPEGTDLEPVTLDTDSGDDQITETDERPTIVPDMTPVLGNLVVPWDVVFLPDRSMLISERDGTLLRYHPDTGAQNEIMIEGVVHSGEGGLLGLALHPRFEENRYIYLYFTSSTGEESVNTLVRYRYEDDMLSEELVLLGDIPGSIFHNGGRIAFGPDGYLYVTTGDARSPSLAQDTSSLAGKILRITDDGSAPEDNPFGNAVYSYGHRNPQGLAWDDEGNLWSTEHGRSGVTSGLDELNLIEAGGNYGWPESQGDTVLSGTVAPVIHSGADVTWAPGGLTYADGSMFFGGLRGETLYEAVLDGESVREFRRHYEGVFGRIRTTLVGPDGHFYLTTSNRDGRGDVRENDDKIIRLNFAQFR